MNFFLLDTNLFREATKSQNNQLLRTLVPALRARGLEFGLGTTTAIRVSPFALLEALGIVPTMPPKLEINCIGKDPKEIYRELFDDACAFFRQLPELQEAFLRRKHAEQIAYVNPEALELFNVCVTGILERDIDITGVFATFLASDYFLKYPFKREVFNSMRAFLAVIFFSDVPENSPASRFRLSMRMFDLIREQMQSLPEYATESAALKIKNSRDLLDTDIVQDITYGFPFNGERHRVVALTFDEARVVLTRAHLHRQVGLSLATKCTEDAFVREVVRPFITHPGGLVVQCDRTGSIVQTIDLSSRFASIARDAAVTPRH
jgi:hypothetical protein